MLRQLPEVLVLPVIATGERSLGLGEEVLLLLRVPNTVLDSFYTCLCRLETYQSGKRKFLY